MKERSVSRRPRAAGAVGGLFLAFEGVEGSGKSTQASLLTDELRRLGHAVVHAREPGSTPLGERIRSLVLDESGLGIPPRSELFLMLAARAAFVEQVVRPALGDGGVVIADRFELSTLAYQGAGRGLPSDQIAACNRFATEGLSPDATVLLELSPDEGLRRQIAASKRPDRMESETRAFHERVARGYTDLATTLDGVVRVDASGTIEDVRQRVITALARRFPETFAQSGFIS
ncbi:MAG: dTMP kinase [Gemmatimonadota bacterium]